MAIGIVEDNDFFSELEKLSNQTSADTVARPTASVEDINVGRGENNNHVPDSLKKIIGETAIEEGRANARALTQSLGISDSSLSAYTNGATSTATYHKPSSELKSHLLKTKRRISKRAVGVLTRAFENITDDKLKAEDARALAGIAKDMSAIIKNMEPEPDRVNGGNTVNNQFVLMAPPVMTEDKFDTIVVSE